MFRYFLNASDAGSYSFTENNLICLDLMYKCIYLCHET